MFLFGQCAVAIKADFEEQIRDATNKLDEMKRDYPEQRRTLSEARMMTQVAIAIKNTEFLMKNTMENLAKLEHSVIFTPWSVPSRSEQ